MVPEESARIPRPPAVPTNRCVPGARTLAELTTIGVGGPIRELVEAHTEDDIRDAVRDADSTSTPLLMVGGGSNILASDAPFDGRVVRDMRSNIEILDVSGCGGALCRVAAGTPWDEFVTFAISEGWMGVEALSGIPGTVGASVVQNIGAYGQEVAETVSSVRVYDRTTGIRTDIPLADLRFGYRTSILKESLRSGDGLSPRWIVLSVTFQLRLASLSAPVRYGQLAARLGVEPMTRVPSVDLREAVLDLRRSKGMVLDDADRATYSCGSFFTNPVITEAQAAELPEDAPRFSIADHTAIAQIGAAAPTIPGMVKTSAAWLIDHAGFPAGYGMPGPAALSPYHCLALCNRGGATAGDLWALAQEIRDGVAARFGVTLEPEPVIVGF